MKEIEYIRKQIRDLHTLGSKLLIREPEIHVLLNHLVLADIEAEKIESQAKIS